MRPWLGTQHSLLLLSFLCSQHGQHEIFWITWKLCTGQLWVCSSPDLPLVRYWVSCMTSSALSQNHSALAQETGRLGSRKEVLVTDSGFRKILSKKRAMAHQGNLSMASWTLIQKQFQATWNHDKHCVWHWELYCPTEERWRNLCRGQSGRERLCRRNVDKPTR